MTSQTLAINSPLYVAHDPMEQDQAQQDQTQQDQTQQDQMQTVETAIVDQQRSRLIEAMKSQYQLDQQVKFLHLQAEADSLLQQLQALKEQRQAVETSSLQ